MKRIVVLCSILLLLVPLTALAQVDFCEGNFDYDRDQDGTDAFTFKTDFGRSTILNPCPPDGPAPVGRTGVTGSYNLGDDGDLERGVAWPNPRYTDNGNGTVTDRLTGLIWLKDANCSIFNAPRTWSDAINIIVPQLEDGYCGLTDGSNPGDWRLPNRFELESLLKLSCASPAISDPVGTSCCELGDCPFNNVQSTRYWSSTTNKVLTAFAWYIHIDDGSVISEVKANTCYVWPVRGGH
jgi:hypothetical protein